MLNNYYFISDPPQKCRVFSLQHLTRLRSSQSQNFQPDTISPTHSLTRRSGEQDRKAINHFLSSGNTVSPSKQRPAAHKNEQQGQSSESISLALSLRRASTNTTLSTRSAKRSTSWFKKYRFLPKLVDSDNPPLLWDFLKGQSKGRAMLNMVLLCILIGTHRTQARRKNWLMVGVKMKMARLVFWKRLRPMSTSVQRYKVPLLIQSRSWLHHKRLISKTNGSNFRLEPRTREFSVSRVQILKPR